MEAEREFHYKSDFFCEKSILAKDSLAQATGAPTAAGRVMAGLLAIFSEFEREILRERVRAGLAHARQNGQRLADPLRLACTPSGYGNSIVMASARPQSRAN